MKRLVLGYLILGILTVLVLTIKSPFPNGPGGAGNPAASTTPSAAERTDDAPTLGVSGGIPWFATWESGLREAQRAGRPILLVAAAPHCAGVSGIW